MGYGLAYGFESIVPTLKKVVLMNNEFFGGEFFHLAKTTLKKYSITNSFSLKKKKVINGILTFRIAKNHHNCLQYGSELSIFIFII